MHHVTGLFEGNLLESREGRQTHALVGDVIAELAARYVEDRTRDALRELDEEAREERDRRRRAVERIEAPDEAVLLFPDEMRDELFDDLRRDARMSVRETRARVLERHRTRHSQGPEIFDPA